MRLPPLLFCAAIVLCGCRPHAQTYDEMTPKDRLNSLRGQAVHAALVESTNEVPGIRAIVETNVDDLSDAIVKWTGVVRLDYQNTIGGIDRTNLHLKFIVASDGRLFASEDSEYYQAQWKARLAELRRAAGLNADGTKPPGWPLSSPGSQTSGK